MEILKTKQSGLNDLWIRAKEIGIYVNNIIKTAKKQI